MKLKYCIVLAILIIFLSLTSVAAGENAADDALMSVENSIDETTDLSVDIEVDESDTDEGHNRKGSSVFWTVTAKAKNGTAYNTRVGIEMSENQKLVSYMPDTGSYDPANGIWKIGNLTGSKDARLLLHTRLMRDGTFTLNAYALTESNDTDLSNNFQSKSIESIKSSHHYPPIGAYAKPPEKNPKKPVYTITTSQKNGADHTSHYGSDSYEGIGKREVVDESAEPSNNETDTLRGSVGKTYSNSGESNFNIGLLIIPLLLMIAVVIVSYRRFKS